MEGRPREERELVLRAQGGDAHAYDALVRVDPEIAFRVAYVITRNTAVASSSGCPSGHASPATSSSGSARG